MSLMGIDIGSSRCKGLAFDYAGKIIAQAEVPYVFSTPAPGRAELDANVFWEAVIQVARIIGAGTAGDPVEAMALACHGETVIPLDGHGEPLSAAIMNADNRAVMQAEKWATTIGREEIYSITGLPLHPMFALNKIQWLKDNQPDLYGRAAHFAGPADYVLMKLGFPAVTDYSLASRYMAFDIRRKQWSEEMLGLAGISRKRLPAPLPAGHVLGRLAPATAALLDLPAGVVVCLGGHDQPCGALGAGSVDSGQIADSAGSYECLSISSAEPLNHARALDYSLNTYCHVIPDRYITLAFFPSGLMVRWFVEQFCGADSLEASANSCSVYDLLAERVAGEPAGPTGLTVIPHLVGSCNPYWDVRATGIFAGLTQDVTRAKLYKAVFEGIACEMALNIQVMQEIAGDFDAVRIFGGNARSAFSVQLRADITGKRILTLPHSEMVCQGAAMLAGIGSGCYKDVREASGFVSALVHEYLPQKESGAEYKAAIDRHNDLFASLETFRTSRA